MNTARMMKRLTVAACGLLLGAAASRAGVISWSGATDNVWDVNATANWSGDSTVFNTGDHVTFSGGANTDPITIVGTVRPASVNITTTGGPFVFSGGTLRYDYGTAVTSLSFGDGPLRLDGATVHLNFLGLSWGQTLDFTTPVVIGSNGGTFTVGPDANGQRRCKVTFTGDWSLGGTLTIAGSGFSNNTINPPRLSGTVTLTDDVTIVNATLRNTSAIPIEMSGALQGATRTLMLNSTNGEGFAFFTPTDTSLNLRTIQSNANLIQFRNGGGIVSFDPMDKLTANGGGLIMGNGASYTVTGQSTFSVYVRPSNITWQGNNTLGLVGDNWNSTFSVREDLSVGGVGNNLRTLAYTPFRGGLTMIPGTTLTIGDGGLFRISIARDDGIERTDGNITLLDGAVVDGINTVGTLRGGLVRGTAGTLTLGNGAASTITIRGNTAAKTQFFPIGYNSFVTDSGNVTLRYASTGTAGQFFNIAWTPGGTTRANAVAFRGGSAKTVFAPGPASIAVVGPDSGTVFNMTTPTILETAGLVGFYNGAAGTDDAARGALGPVAVDGTGTLAFEAAGTVRASDVTFASGSLLSVRLTGAASDACSLLDASGTLTFDAGAAMAVTLADGFAGIGGPWRVATATTSVSGMPKAPAGYALSLSGNDLMLQALPSGTVILVR